MRAVPILLALAAVAAVAPARAASAPPPALAAKEARAQAVLGEVRDLGIRFGKVVDAWDGARIQLATSERRLGENARALRRARRRARLAQTRLAQRLVAVYEGGEPDLADVLVGASSLSEILDRVEAAKTITGYDERVVDAAARAQAQLASARRQLQATTRRKRAAVADLTASRRTIGTMLARRRRLLASVRGEVAVLQRREELRQQRLAAAARERLARERARAAARAKAAAAAAAVAVRPAATTTAPAPTTSAPAATAATTTAVAAPATTAPAPAPAPDLGPGAPQAATIALRYLGVPYRWGGASPATGFDCSGLVMYVYAQLGIQLPHQSEAQWGYGVPVPRSRLLPGDLVFYDGLSHVAIYIGNGDVVHAPQTGDVVKIAPIDAAGGSYVGARRLSLPGS